MPPIEGNLPIYSATAPEYQEYWNYPAEEAPPAYSIITPQEQYWNDNIEPILSEHKREYQDITAEINKLNNEISVTRDYDETMFNMKACAAASVIAFDLLAISFPILLTINPCSSFFLLLTTGFGTAAGITGLFYFLPGLIINTYAMYYGIDSKDFSKIRQIRYLDKEQIKLSETIKYINEHVKGQLFNDFMGTYRYLDSAKESDIELYEKMLPRYARFQNEHSIAKGSQDTIMNYVRAMHVETRRLFDKWVFLKEQGFKHSQSENVLKTLTRIFNRLSDTETLRTIELGNN